MPDFVTPTENNMARVFARIPRPQKVLGTGKIMVPTASTLRQAAEAAKVRVREPSSLAALSNLNAGETGNTELSKRFVQQKDLPPKGSDLGPPEAQMNASIRPLSPVITLGVLTQNSVRWALRAQYGRNGLIMVKKVKPESGKRELEIMQGFNHRNIAKLVHSSVHEDETISISLEYCRCTLAEILFVHLKLEEMQIQCIARSVSSHFCLCHAVNNQCRYSKL
jgi:serine/threonine protein kinase